MNPFMAFGNSIMNAGGSYIAPHFNALNVNGGILTEDYSSGSYKSIHSSSGTPGDDRYSQIWTTKAGSTQNIIMHSHNLFGDNDDYITGGNNNDILFGAGGGNKLNGGAGNDVLVLTGSVWQDFSSADGGDGNDFIALGTSIVGTTPGNFLVQWQQKLSGLTADQLQSVLVRQANAETSDTSTYTYYSARGGNGNDTVLGSESTDNITGGDGVDQLFGEGGNDNIRGDGGNDIIYGGAGHDSMYGGLGDDLIVGEAGNDVLYGGDYLAGGDGGSDTLDAGSGNDKLYGGIGDDYLIGGLGNDTLDGGSDFDVADYSYSSVGVTVNLATGIATGASSDSDTITNIEAVIGSNYADMLIGDALNNVLISGAGDDVISGGMGNDGIDGGTGFDIANYNYSTSGVTVNLLTGTATGVPTDNDTLANIEAVIGSNYNDVLIGNAFDNQLLGGAGNDSLAAGAGSDDYYMGNGSGEDIIFETDAEAGVDIIHLVGNATPNDLLAGRNGNDFLIGLTSGEMIVLQDYYLSGGVEYLEWGGNGYSIAILAADYPASQASSFLENAGNVALAPVELVAVPSTVDAGVLFAA